jgi:hypothetical protein
MHLEALFLSVGAATLDISVALVGWYLCLADQSRGVATLAEKP